MAGFVCQPLQVWSWSAEGHRLILNAALKDLPAEARRIYTGRRNELNRTMAAPDEYHGLPAGSSMHFFDLEKTDPAYVAALRKMLTDTYGEAGFAADDARSIVSELDRSFFRDSPPPLPAPRAAALWKNLLPSLPAFRAAYGDLEVFIGTAVYHPYLYAAALSCAIAEGNPHWIVRHAGSLAHFTGDLGVPFHLTANYKGQYSENLIFDDRERGDVHGRFETGFVKSRVNALSKELRRRRHDPRVLTAGEIRDASVSLASQAYLDLTSLLDADRAACARCDPRTDWEGYLREADPVFSEIALRGLVRAADTLADLLLTARSGNLCTRYPRSAKMK